MTLMERRRGMMGAKSEANGLADMPLRSLSNGSYEVKKNTFYLGPTINANSFAWCYFINPLQLSAGDVLTISFLLLEGDAYYLRCAINSHYPGQKYGVLQKDASFVDKRGSVSFTMRSEDPPIEKMALASPNPITQSKKIKISVAVNGEKLF